LQGTIDLIHGKMGNKKVIWEELWGGRGWVFRTFQRRGNRTNPRAFSEGVDQTEKKRLEKGKAFLATKDI